MDLWRTHLTRWSSEFADPAQERRFREKTAPVERDMVLTSVVAVLVIGAVAFGYDYWYLDAAFSEQDLYMQALIIVIVAAALICLRPRNRHRWRLWGPIIVFCLEAFVVAMIAIAPGMSFRGALLQVGVVVLLYLMMRFSLRVVFLLAASFSAMSLFVWLEVASGTDWPDIDIAFTVALVVIAHLFGMFEARRGQRERRIAFAQADALRRLSTQDELTGLGNRRRFYQIVDRHLQKSTARAATVAVLLIDIDRFKDINDTFGHQAGDNMLKEIARRLERSLPDAHALARLGGDEFVALIPAPTSGAALHSARRFLDVLEEPIRVDGLELRVRASIGISTSGDSAEGRAALMRHADVAMYQVKARGGGAAAEYTAARDEHSRDRVALVGELSAALETDQIVMYYQPKADLKTGSVDSVEALIRWHHPERGLLMPGDFLPLAEQHGLMSDLTLKVISLALNQAVAWRAAGHDLTIAVNLAAANLLDTRFPDTVADLVERSGGSADLLQLEISEDTILVDPERILTVLNRLNDAGFTFSLDDYGTGYSSLAYLRLLPVTELKIDRSFVSNIVTDVNDAVIVRSTIDMARSLGFNVVAEGVEDRDTWRRLADFGCHTAQGYLLSRPIPADELEAWLENHARTFINPSRVPHSVRPVPAGPAITRPPGGASHPDPGTIRDLHTDRTVTTHQGEGHSPAAFN